MTFTGPNCLPPAKCHVLETEAFEKSSGRFTSLLHQLLTEHHRCMQELTHEVACKSDNLRSSGSAPVVVSRTAFHPVTPPLEAMPLHSPRSPREVHTTTICCPRDVPAEQDVLPCDFGVESGLVKQVSPPESNTSHLSRKTSSEVHFYRRVSVASVQSTVSNMGPKKLNWAQLLEHPAVELFVACLILLNSACMAAEMQYLGFKAGYASSFPTFNERAHKRWPNADDVFTVLERTFTVIFTIELALRLAIIRWRLFKHVLNWIDIICVVISLLDWAQDLGTFFDPKVGRLLRIAKLTRGLRLVKLTAVLSSLHLLCKCIAASISTLSWSVCLLLLSQCISGMILCQLVHDYIMDESNPLASRQEVFAYYGTFSRSMITMFEVHLANFGPACRVLLDNVGEEYSYVFLAYRCLAGYAIINVINAVFVQQTIAIAQQDQDVVLNEKRKQGEAYAKKLRNFLGKVDADGDGLITEQELVTFEEDPTFKLWMSTLDIDHADMQGLFRIVDVDGDGVITHEELISAASRVKGPAKSVDMVQVISTLHKMNHKVNQLFRSLGHDTPPMSPNPIGGKTWK